MTVFTQSALIFSECSYFNLKVWYNEIQDRFKVRQPMASEAKIPRPANDRQPDFFEKCTNLKQLYQSSLEHKNFLNLKKHNCFTYLLSKRSVLLYKRLVRDEKLKEVSVSSFFELIITLLLRRNWWIHIVPKPVDLVKLGAAIVRELRHFTDEQFKMFLMQCKKDAGRLFCESFVGFVTYRHKCLTVISVEYQHPGGDSWYFRTGVCHYKISISTLSGIFDEKVGPFSEFLCLMEVSKVWFWGLFWEKMASIFKNFSKNCGFLSKLGQRNQSIQSSLVCHLCHQNNWPYMEFLTDIIALSGIFVKNWHTLFGIFSWKCDPNSWHTPMYSSYGSSPPGISMKNSHKFSQKTICVNPKMTKQDTIWEYKE